MAALSGGIEVACDVDIEKTAESFHAHAVPDGIDIQPGDVVVVHDMPDHVAFGDCYQRRGNGVQGGAGGTDVDAICRLIRVERALRSRLSADLRDGVAARRP